MPLLTSQERIALRVMTEMSRQHLNHGHIARRTGWTEAYISTRLGLAVPGRLGGRVALTRIELATFARALRVPVEQFTGEQGLAVAAA